MKRLKKYLDMLRFSEKKKYYFTALVCVWALLFAILLIRGPLEKDNLAYLQDSKTTHHTASIPAILQGQKVKINLDLKTMNTNDLDYASLMGVFVKSVQKASRLPLSEEGFKTIVCSDIAGTLLRKGELGRDEYFRVSLNID